LRKEKEGDEEGENDEERATAELFGERGEEERSYAEHELVCSGERGSVSKRRGNAKRTNRRTTRWGRHRSRHRTSP
jgi:hypothetical protein